jgi:magnesium chelatase subunit H
MPGKQAGLSGDCWPDRLLGSIPNFYLYAANNPSEAIIAKRRSGATIVSYLTPPLAEAGLYKGFADLKALVERWRALAGEGVERAALEVMIRDCATALDIDGSDIAALAGNLYELERALIPFGLHVLGSQPQGEERAAFLDALTAGDNGAGRAELDAKLAANDELGALIHALDGGYVRPAPGGDILHNPEVLPTGRNTHGFDPFRIPSAFACVTGAAQADALLARHVEAGEPLPESIAMVLWGTDNLKSEGTQVAQALHLMGARAALRHLWPARRRGADPAR